MVHRFIDNLGNYIFFKKKFSSFFSKFKISFLFLFTFIIFLISNLMSYISIFNNNPSIADMIFQPIVKTFILFLTFFFYILYYSYSDLIILRKKDKKITINTPMKYNFLTIFNRSLFMFIASFTNIFLLKLLFVALFLFVTFFMKKSMYKGFISSDKSWILILPVLLEIIFNFIVL